MKNNTYNNDVCPNQGLARAYVPMQKICDFYEPEEGLCMGTIFPDLAEPYEPYKK